MLPQYIPASELLKKYSNDPIVKAAAAKEATAQKAETVDTSYFKMWKPDLKALAANGDKKARKELDRRAAKKAAKRKTKMN